MTDAGPILEMTGVTRSFPQPGGEVTALAGVSFAIQPGEFIALTGPSGSGKSTLLNLSALLDQPSTGRVRLAGRDTSSLGERTLCAWRARQVGMVFQRFHLLPRRTVEDNVRMRFRYLDVPSAEREAGVRDALERVDLSALARRPARVLSGGEMQRVAIARAVALPPALLVADEPTGNLDAANSHRIMDLFSSLHAQGMTILMATHNPALLSRCTRVLRLESGRLRENC